ncbi:ankyrin repeat domain containing protein [Perkinsus marinus ATCC 50983]|uniref:Ankyrin repeat domain containing protein n=1 Tax=Perkinsus marinus (strain ATCC 50983 / TXsc) TaxID=423536 RepID=C5LAG6_PERM5|nr:ankyrin repeat domain containing protein [Perkinsus marinus ATCC 50983]EER06422.1 ankyrin repeat domain containing protein [Perkinsus marinus ATCC 50983]|eukprot:XP_002774606.1 ankyrin repeat domain containing protein [Perkinsus marinus ATCC 50983]
MTAIRKDRDKMERKTKDLQEDRDKLKQRLKKYYARRRLFEIDQRTCKNCNKEYMESANFNWSCRTHQSEFGGELWWCCGKTGKDAPGCKFAKHESKDEDEYNTLLDEDDVDEENGDAKEETGGAGEKNRKHKPRRNVRCFSCKEMGHSAEACPKDPNMRIVWGKADHTAYEAVEVIALADKADFDDINSSITEKAKSRSGAITALVNAKSRTGDTLLTLAAKHNSRKCIEVLTRLGCDVNAQDASGRTAFFIACARNNVAIAKHLFHRAACDPDIVDDGGFTGFASALLFGNAEIVRWWLTRVSRSAATDEIPGLSNTASWSPFLLAVHLGHFEIVRTLSQYIGKVSMNAKDAEGRGALFLAAFGGRLELAE